MEGTQNEKEKSKNRHIYFLSSIHGIVTACRYDYRIRPRRNNTFWICNKHRYRNDVYLGIPAGVYQ